MLLPASTVGRKIVMAITGQVLVAFILFHIVGNSTFFFHKLNAYVVALHRLPIMVWTGRLILAAAFALHVIYGVVLKLENAGARSRSYAITAYNHSTFAGRNQIWTGIFIGAFLIYHLLHFTFQVLDTVFAADLHPDLLGRPDVFHMVLQSFQQTNTAIAYLIGVAFLALHLLHGVQSSLQTLGLNNERTLPVIEKTGAVASLLLFFWYAAIPAVIVLGFLK